MKKQDEQVYYNPMEEPVVIPKATTDAFLKQDNPGDLMALYQFYYYTAKWQKTNQPHATGKYCMKALKWGRQKYMNARNTLIKLGLIEEIKRRDEEGKIVGNYIKVKFLWSKEKEDSIQMYQTRQVDETTSGKSTTNALSSNNRNALNSNTESTSRSSGKKVKKIYKSKKNNSSVPNKEGSPANNKEDAPASNRNNGGITPGLFDEFWQLYPRKVSKGKARTIWNRLCARKKDRPEWDTLKSALIEQKKTEQWQETKFIPHPSTWLNQSRWEDDPAQMKLYEKENTQQQNRANNAYRDNPEDRIKYSF